MCTVRINFQQEPQVFDREIKEVGFDLVFSFDAKSWKYSLKCFSNYFFVARLAPLAVFA